MIRRASSRLSYELVGVTWPRGGTDRRMHLTYFIVCPVEICWNLLLKMEATGTYLTKIVGMQAQVAHNFSSWPGWLLLSGQDMHLIVQALKISFLCIKILWYGCSQKGQPESTAGSHITNRLEICDPRFAWIRVHICILLLTVEEECANLLPDSSKSRVTDPKSN